MSDIVERLKEPMPRHLFFPLADALCMEAADEITRLRQLLSEAEKREKEAREKALEEAAAIADKVAAWRERLFKANKHTDNAAKSSQSRVIADAIRALKSSVDNENSGE